MKILITGASRGIGLACVKKYIEMGHEVFGFDITESSFSAPSYTHMLVDITGSLPPLDGIEILINNAGIQDGPKVIETNLSATIAVTEKYGITPGNVSTTLHRTRKKLQNFLKEEGLC